MTDRDDLRARLDALDPETKDHTEATLAELLSYDWVDAEGENLIRRVGSGEIRSAGTFGPTTFDFLGEQ